MRDLIDSGGMKIVLASNSPRRKQLLGQLVGDFEIVPPTQEEKCSVFDPADMVAELSKQKAEEVFSTKSDSLVLGCDTVVSLDGVVFGKPKNAIEAKDILTKLSGKKHDVFTGVTLVCATGTKTFVEKTVVEFFELADNQIEQYIKTGSCFDKAGAYGIQDSNFVKSIEGSFSNVMGLPVETLKKQLEMLGIKTKTPPAQTFGGNQNG